MNDIELDTLEKEVAINFDYEKAKYINQALQEKREREKGCEYCNDFSFIQKGYFVDNSKSEILGINNCCINCGRKLGEKNLR